MVSTVQYSPLIRSCCFFIGQFLLGNGVDWLNSTVMLQLMLATYSCNIFSTQMRNAKEYLLLLLFFIAIGTLSPLDFTVL